MTFLKTSLIRAMLLFTLMISSSYNFIHLKFVKRLRVGMQELEHPMKIWNIDGTTNRAGRLTHFVDLLVQTKGQEKKMRFLVMDLSVKDIILGYPWL